MDPVPPRQIHQNQVCHGHSDKKVRLGQLENNNHSIKAIKITLLLNLLLSEISETPRTSRQVGHLKSCFAMK